MLFKLNSKIQENLNLKTYENYRWFFTSKGNLVIGGKNEAQNEIVMKKFLKPSYTILHTSFPGSPFMIVLTENPTERDIEEAAVVCACFSKQWKEGKKRIEVDVFKGENVYKTKKMKIGTFGVKGEKKKIKVKPELILVFQAGKLRAVPSSTKIKKIALIKQGKLSKEEAAKKIMKKIKDKFHLPITKEEVMQAIPSDKIDVQF